MGPLMHHHRNGIYSGDNNEVINLREVELIRR